MKLKKIKINEKVIFTVFLFTISILIFFYIKIFIINNANNKFTKQSIAISEKNKNTIFSLEKIILTSSADAQDSSENNNLKKLDIFQYTDIAIYINNGEELTNKNTVKNLYIDNIELNVNKNQGNQTLDYKNFQKFGLASLKDEEQHERIDFNIVYTNEENLKTDYNNPTFYTDCSNPITLGYVNKGIVKDFNMGENTSVSFDGKILKAANINQEDIDTNIVFRINLENNENEKYSCWLNFDLPLKDIFNGVSMKVGNLSGKKYNFFCETY